MDPLDNGDRSRLDELLSEAPTGSDPAQWEVYSHKMQELADLRDQSQRVDEYSLLVRECASRLLSLFEERG